MEEVKVDVAMLFEVPKSDTFFSAEEHLQARIMRNDCIQLRLCNSRT
jgi:hypothetical protein